MAATNTSNDSTKEKKSKWRLSSLRHDKDKDLKTVPEVENTPTAHQDTPTTHQNTPTTLQNTPTTHPNPQHPLHNEKHAQHPLHNENTTAASDYASHEPVVTDDSTYGSSTRDSRESGNFPTISGAQAAEQNAPLHTQKDKKTGRTITTTTTTTTTTVTSIDGEEVQIPAGQEVRVTETTEESAPAELSAQPVSPGVHAEKTRNPLTVVGGSAAPRTRTPSPQPQISAAVIERYGGQQPKSNNTLQTTTTRDSPVSPIRPTPNNSTGNFSYPARPTNTNVQPSAPQYQQQYDPSHNTQQQGPQPYHQGGPVQGNHQPSTYGGITSSPHHQSLVPPPRSQTRPYYDEVPHDHEHEHEHGHDHAPFQPQNSFHQPGEQPGHPGYNTNTNINSPYGQHTTPGQQQQPLGTLASLKAAAAGIHGAGETLRGALNSSLERRTGADPSRVAAHDAVRDRGMQEIQTGKFYKAPSAGAGTAGSGGYAPPTGTAVDGGRAPQTSYLGGSSGVGQAQGQGHTPLGQQPHTPLGQQTQTPTPGLQHSHTPGLQQVNTPGSQPTGGQPGQRYDPLEGNWVGSPEGGTTASAGEGSKGGKLRNVLRRKEVPGRT